MPILDYFNYYFPVILQWKFELFLSVPSRLDEKAISKAQLPVHIVQPSKLIDLAVLMLHSSHAAVLTSNKLQSHVICMILGGCAQRLFRFIIK